MRQPSRPQRRNCAVPDCAWYDSTAPGPFKTERALFDARQNELAAIQQAARARSEQAYRALAEAQATLAARQSVARQAREEAAMIRPLVEQGYEPWLSLMKLDAQALTASSDAAAVGRAQAQIAEATAGQARQTGDWRSRVATELAQQGRNCRHGSKCCLHSLIGSAEPT